MKSKIAFVLVPLLTTLAFVPAAPVVVVPTVISGLKLSAYAFVAGWYADVGV